MTFLAGVIPAKSPEPPPVEELLVVVAPGLLPNAAPAANAPSPPSPALGVVAKSPPCSGFVSALSLLEGIGDGVLEIFLLDELVVAPNIPRVGSVLTVPESVGLVASQLNVKVFGFVLSGFGDGVLCF